MNEDSAESKTNIIHRSAALLMSTAGSILGKRRKLDRRIPSEDCDIILSLQPTQWGAEGESWKMSSAQENGTV